MEKFKSISAQMHQLEDDYQKRRAELKAEIVSYIDNMDTASNEFINFYYWKSGLPLDLLEKVTGMKPQKISRIVDKHKIDITCTKCGKVVPYYQSSRSDIVSASDRKRFICDPCHYKEDEKAYKKKRQRTNELRSMPYMDYLQTTHWKNTRRQALMTAKYTCQKCGTEGGALQVHHLTYDRRGCELMTDLLVVCEPCHQKLHGIQIKPLITAEQIMKVMENTFSKRKPEKKPTKRLKKKAWKQ